MTDQYVPALRRRFLEDMRIKGLLPKTVNPGDKVDHGIGRIV